MNKLNIPKEQLISNSDMTKFVEDVLSDFYKDKDLVEFAKSYNFSSSGIFIRDNSYAAKPTFFKALL